MDYLKEFSEGGLPMLFQHDQNEIIGQWDSFQD